MLNTAELDPLSFSADTLVHLALEIFSELNIIQDLHVPVVRLQRFILAVRDRYAYVCVYICMYPG